MTSLWGVIICIKEHDRTHTNVKLKKIIKDLKRKSLINAIREEIKPLYVYRPRGPLMFHKPKGADQCITLLVLIEKTTHAVYTGKK